MPLFRKLVASLPDTSHRVLQPRPADFHHFFTDGACKQGKDVRTRISAWAVVAADLHHDTFTPIGADLLAGFVQTAVRAEATAAAAALKAGLDGHKPFCIWTDNLQVHRRLEQLREDTWWPGPLTKDHDLWTVIGRLISQGRHLFARAVKVTSKA